ncbi:MAG: O-antigen ligase family protein [Porticoccaceae bacterium]|nr:O-antigen ligase family protein [Porticoccaceae bacterium]
MKLNPLSFRAYENWGFYSLLSLIAWLPIPLGSKYPLGWGIMEIATFGLLSLWLLTQVFKQKNYGASINPISKIVLLLFIASLAYQLFQTAPLTLETIRFLSPQAFEVYSFTEELAPKKSYSLSLDRGLTLQEFLKSASYISIFFLTLVLVNSRKRLKQLAFVLISVGFAEALFGLVDVLAGGQLFRIPFTGIGGTNYSATGTYTNYNHFGGLLEMAIPLSIGMLLSTTMVRETQSNWRARLRVIFQGLLSPRLWLYAVTTTMIIALLYSKSRGANLSLISATILTTGLVLLFKKSKTNKQKSASLLVLIFPLLIGISLGANPLFSRLETQGLQSNRNEFRDIAYEVIADYPVFGIGSGNWGHVYMAYQSAEAGAYNDYRLVKNVHNDYLELLVEQGIIGFVLFGSAVLLALSTMIVALCRRRDPFMHGILWACVTAVFSLLSHSLADYNFHIPANAAWFSVILAMGLIASRMPRDA